MDTQRCRTPPEMLLATQKHKTDQSGKHYPEQARHPSQTKHLRKTEKEIKEIPTHSKITFEAAAAVCGTSSIYRQVLPASRPDTLLPSLPSPSCFRQPRLTSSTAVVVLLSYPPGGNATDNTKPTKKESTTKNKEQARHPPRHTRYILCENVYLVRKTENKKTKTKTQPNQIRFSRSSLRYE